MNPPFILRSSWCVYKAMMQSQNPTLSWRTLRGLLCAACLAWASAGGIAGESHDRARKALEAGEVLPLRTILERIERDYPGQVMDVELERQREAGAERWVYEIKLLRTGGALVKLKVDARDGSVISHRVRDRAEGEPAGPRPPFSTGRH